MVEAMESAGLDAHVREIAEVGYTVFSGVLTAEEVASLRHIVAGHLDKRFVRLGPARIQPNAAVEIPALGWMFTHPKVLKVARAVMGKDSVCFTSHCDAHLNVGSNWHKDSGDQLPEGNYFRADPYTTPGCRVYKFAFYLQDHRSDNGSLRVSDRSHIGPSLKAEHPRTLHPALGDMIVFDVRVVHAGEDLSQFQKLTNRALEKAGTLGADMSFVQRRLSLKLQNRPDRYALFFTYGVKNELTTQFAIHSMERQISQYPATGTRLAPELQNALKEAEVAIVENEPGWPQA